MVVGSMPTVVDLDTPLHVNVKSVFAYTCELTELPAPLTVALKEVVVAVTPVTVQVAGGLTTA
jgi:hypothetical protein